MYKVFENQSIEIRDPLDISGRGLKYGVPYAMSVAISTRLHRYA